MAERKVCVKCKFHKMMKVRGLSEDHCLHNQETSMFFLIHGEGGHICEEQRNHHGQCGPDGVLFRPKETK